MPRVDTVRTGCSGPRVDKNSIVPYHYQLAELLRNELQSGRWCRGDVFWSEADLCAYHEVSRSVVRQALGQLAQEGFVKRMRGRGTLVAETRVVDDVLKQLEGFYGEMSSRGVPHRTEVLKAEVRKVHQPVAGFLRVEAGTRVFYTERLRFLHDAPYVFVTSVVPYQLCPGIERRDLHANSLYTVLQEEYGLRAAYARRLIEARNADDVVAQLLGVPPGAAMVVLRSFAYLPDGRVLEYHEGIHRADRVAFEVLVGTTSNRPDALKPVAVT